MAADGVIGGNLEDIGNSATRIDASGTKAIDTSQDTKTAADEVETAITQTMDGLIKRFGEIAEALNDDIKDAHKQLEGTAWTGKSQEAALAIKTDLQGQVGTIMTNATTAFTDERNAMVLRSQALVDSVTTEFNNVMVEVNTKFGDLATAARLTATNLATADETIKVGSVG